jgi:hypothetical protein
MTDGNDERPMRTEAALNPSAVPDPARGSEPYCRNELEIKV